jgi:Protein of unknown function (DUF1573)
MSDDFGTVNVRRGDRAREIEVLRQHYRAHRDALGRMIADAPTEQLAAEYQRLIAGIDESMRKLDELEGRPTTQAGTQAVPSGPSMTSPGMRPLSADPVTEPQRYVDEPPPADNSGSRTLLIIVVGALVLGAIMYLIWRASRDRRPAATTTGSVVEQPVTPATADTIAPATTAPVTPTPAAAAGGALKVTPALHDYGVVRKGTRAVRQFDAMNGGTAPIEIQVTRSACHCLIYDYNARIAPGARETITVTVDGAKAKAGALDEQVAVKEKKSGAALATIAVRAIVK